MSDCPRCGFEVQGGRCLNRECETRRRPGQRWRSEPTEVQRLCLERAREFEGAPRGSLGILIKQVAERMRASMTGERRIAAERAAMQAALAEGIGAAMDACAAFRQPDERITTCAECGRVRGEHA